MYTVDEVAALLQLKPTTIRTWLKEGKLRGEKIGKSWRISTEELKRLFPEDKFFVTFKPEEQHNPSGFNLYPEMEKNKELAKVLYPEQYNKQHWHEVAINSWEHFGNELKREISKEYPYPFKDDDIAYWNQDKTDYLEGGDIEAWAMYYSLKLEDEERKFEKLINQTKEKYNIENEEIEEIKRFAKGIHLLKCAKALYDKYM